jgi:hypothetical protein
MTAGKRLWLATLCFVLMGNASPALGGEIRVGPGHPYSTIQQGVDAAEEGDVVLVASGNYRETVTLRPGITLRGEGADTTVVLAERKDPVLKVFAADGVRISGFHLAHEPGDYPCGGAVVEIGKSRDVRVFDNRIEGSGVYGIFINASTEVVVARNHIFENEAIGVKAWGSQVEIVNNLLWDNTCGLELAYHGGLYTVVHNTVIGGEVGIHATAELKYDGSKHEVRDNLVVGVSAEALTIDSETVDLGGHGFWGNASAGTAVAGLAAWKKAKSRYDRETKLHEAYPDKAPAPEPLGPEPGPAPLPASSVAVEGDPEFANAAIGDYGLGGGSPMSGAASDSRDLGMDPSLGLPWESEGGAAASATAEGALGVSGARAVGPAWAVAGGWSRRLLDAVSGAHPQVGEAFTHGAFVAPTDSGLLLPVGDDEALLALRADHETFKRFTDLPESAILDLSIEDLLANNGVVGGVDLHDIEGFGDYLREVEGLDKFDLAARKGEIIERLAATHAAFRRTRKEVLDGTFLLVTPGPSPVTLTDASYDVDAQILKLPKVYTGTSIDDRKASSSVRPLKQGVAISYPLARAGSLFRQLGRLQARTVALLYHDELMALDFYRLEDLAIVVSEEGSDVPALTVIFGGDWDAPRVLDNLDAAIAASGGAAGGGRVDILEIDPHWTVDEAALNQKLMAKRPEFDACYQTALAAEPGLSGQMRLALDVMGNRVGFMQVHEDSVGNADLNQCVQNALRGTALPPVDIVPRWTVDVRLEFRP